MLATSWDINNFTETLNMISGFNFKSRLTLFLEQVVRNVAKVIFVALTGTFLTTPSRKYK